MRKMKDSGVEWIGDIPESWDAVKLSYLFEIIGSGTTPTSTNSDYYDGEYNWLQTGDLNDKEITTTSKTITQKAVDDYSTLALYNKGTIVMAMYGATIGKLGILNIDSYTNQACCAMSRPVNIQPKFVYYWLMCNKENIVNLSMGGGQPNISQGIISTLKITIPKEITKQNEIVKYLDKKCEEIDALIKAKEKANELLKEQRQSIIYEAVTKGLNPEVPMKNSGIDWIGEISENAKLMRMKYVGDIFGRIGFRGYTQSDLVSEGEGPITLSPSNVGESGMDYSKCTYLSWDKYEESPEIQIKNGDILMVKTGSSYGKSAIVENLPMEATINPQFIVIKNIKCNPKYLFYYMQTELFKYQVEEAVVGGTIPTMAQEKISSFHLVIYGEKVTEEIVKYLDEKCGVINQLISLNNDTIEKLKEYRKSIIFEAVTGKVEIS